jgi:hypothetical protein
MNKMESVDEWKQRQNNKLLTSMKTKTPQSSTKKHQTSNNLPNKEPLTNNYNKPATSTTSSTLTKPTASTLGRSMSLNVKTPFKPTMCSSSTPKQAKPTISAQKTAENKNLNSNNLAVAGSLSTSDPKTPVMNTSSSNAKTPTSNARPKPQGLLKSAIKNSALSGLNTSINTNNNDITQSAFFRRKSYDLSLSLSKPIKYKQYTGKLKPVDFNAKSVFLANLAAGTGTNPNNETKIADKTNLNGCTNRSSASPSQKSSQNLDKRRLSTVKLSGIRNDPQNYDKNVLNEHAKSEKLKAENEKSTQLIKKLNCEKMKLKKQQQTDKNRNLNEVNENQAPKVS